MPTLQADHPNVKPVLDLLDQVGFNHSMLTEKGVILGGSVNPLKACRIKAFRDHITGEGGMIGRDSAQTGELEGRRALLAYVVDTLVNGLEVELVKHEQPHSPTVDEIFELNVNGTEIKLVLMPN